MSGVGVAAGHFSTTHQYSSLEWRTGLLINSLRKTPQGIFKNFPQSHIKYPDHWGGNYLSKSAFNQALTCRERNTSSWSNSEEQVSIIVCEKVKAVFVMSRGFWTKLFHLSVSQGCFLNPLMLSQPAVPARSNVGLNFQKDYLYPKLLHLAEAKRHSF